MCRQHTVATASSLKPPTPEPACRQSREPSAYQESHLQGDAKPPLAAFLSSLARGESGELRHASHDAPGKPGRIGPARPPPLPAGCADCSRRAGRVADRPARSRGLAVSRNARHLDAHEQAGCTRPPARPLRDHCHAPPCLTKRKPCTGQPHGLAARGGMRRHRPHGMPGGRGRTDAAEPLLPAGRRAVLPGRPRVQ